MGGWLSVRERGKKTTWNVYRMGKWAGLKRRVPDGGKPLNVHAEDLLHLFGGQVLRRQVGGWVDGWINETMNKVR